MVLNNRNTSENCSLSAPDTVAHSEESRRQKVERHIEVKGGAVFLAFGEHYLGWK
jgi:hypothetical protein